MGLIVRKLRTILWLVSLLVTEGLSYTLQEAMPSTWLGYLSHKKSDCMVFINHFMNHQKDAASYNALAMQVEG